MPRRQTGIEWTMDPANPVMTLGVPVSGTSVGESVTAVLSDGTQFHMWYSGMDDDTTTGEGTPPRRTGSSGRSTPTTRLSTSGRPVRGRIVGVRPDAVVFDGETFKMWYSGWNGSTAVQVGYAESPDGVHWTRRAEPVLAWEELPYPGARASRRATRRSSLMGQSSTCGIVCADLAANRVRLLERWHQWAGTATIR